MNKHGSTTTSSTADPQAPENSTSISHMSSSSPVIVATPSTTSLEPEDEKDMETAREHKGGGAHTSQQDQSTSTSTVGADEVVVKQEHPQVKEKVGKHGKMGKNAKTKKHKHVKDETSSDESSSDASSDHSDSSVDEHERRRKKKKAMKEKEKRRAKVKAKKRKSKKQDFSSDESDSNSSSSSDSEFDSKSKKGRQEKKAKAKAKKHKSKKYESSSSSSDSESDSGSEKKHRKKKSKKAKKARKDELSSDSSSSKGEKTRESVPVASTVPLKPEEAQQLMERLAQMQLQNIVASNPAVPPPVPEATTKKTETKAKTKESSKGKLEYKRVDQVWDDKIRDYKYTESSEKKNDEFDCVFSVRRKFNSENKYLYDLVDIKSNLLRDALKEILRKAKSLSLVEETPCVDPNMLFLYYDEIKAYYKKTLKTQLKKEKKKKHKKRLTRQIAHCKLLAGYIDKDYESTRKRLYPMLKAGNITFELIWALFKPNTIAYTPTYGNKDDPRCFKVDYTASGSDFLEREWWSVYGRFLEYDGKVFGLGDHRVRIESFKGPRKITNLATYPLSYHKDPDGLRTELIERGKKFVTLQGMNYRFHNGLAYQEVKKGVAKHNVNGRVMIDPAIFRRINPNYPLPYLRNKDDEAEEESDEEESDDSRCPETDSDSDSEGEGVRVLTYRDKNGNIRFTGLPPGSYGSELASQKLEAIESEDGATHTFTEEELLIASPVVLGFAFSDKLWLEFSLSGIKEIEWNEDAFDSLVLPKHIKQNLKGLVSSHRFNAAKTIDDIIQGKGKGLNVVLHGPPGVGKTLTGESIADFLKCPLYAVSAGELGTNSRALEADLNRIMDITHSWGAILLLDEADVFLEQRQAQDLHRNSLVSVFLRLLEYYQGILFLTTNRVETFDEAFQSRIHMGIRYENLTSKARNEIWQYHVRKIEALENQESVPFTEADFVHLSKKVLNGRQIKNTVITAQSIALAENDPFSLAQVKRVLDAADDFEVDMRGGMGYRDAMRQYT